MVTQEPAVVFGVLGKIAEAVIPVLILGGFVHWDDKMVAAVMFLISVVVTGLGVIFVRSQTVTTTQADKQIRVALNEPATTSVAEVVEKAK